MKLYFLKLISAVLFILLYFSLYLVFYVVEYNFARVFDFGSAVADVIRLGIPAIILSVIIYKLRVKKIKSSNVNNEQSNDLKTFRGKVKYVLKSPNFISEVSICLTILVLGSIIMFFGFDEAYYIKLSAGLVFIVFFTSVFALVNAGVWILSLRE